MSENNSLYITTTIPYVNADPHIGFALEIVHADIFARFESLRGKEVFFNTGSDEHGVKIWKAALASGKSPQAYVDGYAERYRKLKGVLGLLPDINFIRTTSDHHMAAAQEFWKKCAAAGDIYKKYYEIKYCIGCELEKTDSELENGRCPVHPNLEIEFIKEENYFFRWSKYEKKLIEFYEMNQKFVVPATRFNEIKAFVSRGLKDFSISRLKAKMPWGVPVPDDSDHIMFVWFDAFINYISAIGWPDDMKKFNKWWPVVQVAGKDMVRQQAAMWQAMLMSVGLPPSKQIIIHGFITSGGQKISKSLGNVVHPDALVQEFGTDALRFFLAKEISYLEDSDFTIERFKNSYNADLANGLGNVVGRIMKMANTWLDAPVQTGEPENMDQYFKYLENFEINKASGFVWSQIKEIDKYIQENAPFTVVKLDKEKGKAMIVQLVKRLYDVATMLEPILPTTSAKIKMLIKENAVPAVALFPRKD